MPCWRPALGCTSASMPCISKAFRCKASSASSAQAPAVRAHCPKSDSLQTPPLRLGLHIGNGQCRVCWAGPPTLQHRSRPREAPDAAPRACCAWHRAGRAGLQATPGCGPRPPPSSTGASAGCASCPWAGTRRACPSCSQSAAHGRWALEGPPVRPTPIRTQPQAGRCQASAPVQPIACQLGQRVKELTAARGTGRRAHRARVAVGDAVEPAWARAGSLTNVAARLRQQPETCRRAQAHRATPAGCRSGPARKASPGLHRPPTGACLHAPQSI